MLAGGLQFSSALSTVHTRSELPHVPGPVPPSDLDSARPAQEVWEEHIADTSQWLQDCLKGSWNARRFSWYGAFPFFYLAQSRALRGQMRFCSMERSFHWQDGHWSHPQADEAHSTHQRATRGVSHRSPESSTRRPLLPGALLRPYQVYTHKCMHTCAHAHAHTCGHTNARHTCARTNTHACAHKTYIHMHTHMHTTHTNILCSYTDHSRGDLCLFAADRVISNREMLQGYAPAPLQPGLGRRLLPHRLVSVPSGRTLPCHSQWLFLERRGEQGQRHNDNSRLVCVAGATEPHWAGAGGRERRPRSDLRPTLAQAGQPQGAGSIAPASL